jgi:glycosyltransferase involved in cell wall biosynthesis
MTFRHYYLAKEFIKLGHETTIATGAYSHFLKKFPSMENKTYKEEDIDGINYIWIKVIKYKQSFDKKRVYKWFEFMLKIFFISKKLKRKPDYIICSPTAPFSILPAYYLAKKFNAKLIYEVRDIWPLTLVHIGNINKKHLLIRVMSWFERFALRRSDLIVSNLQNYGDHIKELGINRDFLWVSNGIFLDEMQGIKSLPKTIEEKIPNDKFIIGYTGTIGVANAVEYLLMAAKDLRKLKDLLFVVVGDGKEKANLVEKYGDLENVLFIDPIKKEEIQSMLKLFNVCYIGLKKKELFKYGVSPNKLFDYMYSAKPILYAIDSGRSNIIRSADCGVAVEAENVCAIKSGIQELYHMNEKAIETLGKNGKKYVLENFTYDKLATKYIRSWKECCFKVLFFSV